MRRTSSGVPSRRPGPGASGPARRGCPARPPPRRRSRPRRPGRAVLRRRAASRHPRASAGRPARWRSTGGSGRSLPAPGRHPPTSRPPPPPPVRGAPRRCPRRPAGSGPRSRRSRMETTPTRSAVVDHGEVPVVVVGQPRPGLDDLVVGPEHVGVGGHPPPDRIGQRIGPGGRGPQQVPLGEDPGDGRAVGHHHRSDLPAVHQGGGLGQRRVDVAGDRGGRHQLLYGGGHGFVSSVRAALAAGFSV